MKKNNEIVYKEIHIKIDEKIIWELSKKYYKETTLSKVIRRALEDNVKQARIDNKMNRK